jgi:phosphoenolpyruvate synthase/pyruvate phosphate dikinase
MFLDILFVFLIYQNVIYFRAVEIFESTEISERLQILIFDELDTIFGGNNWIDLQKRFAVRSSAVGEDSEDLSSAGQNETFLGCKGKKAILVALSKCWGSLFAYQSVEYRRYMQAYIIGSTFWHFWAVFGG